MLVDLIEKVLEHLRSHADFSNNGCAHAVALADALNLAALSDKERDQIDLTQSVSSWPMLDQIKLRLTNQYETLLDIDLGDCASDVLIWEGIDVAKTYGDPEVEPDAEHLSLAVLIKEGVVSELASANWDGLVEKAVVSLSEGASPLAVCVQSSDLQEAQNRPKLIKFHGCAVRAAENEAVYRPYLVGRASQIANWVNDGNVKALAGHLETTICERPTLMLGLSVQDFNIQNLFGAAQKKLGWSWPGARPSYVFPEQRVTVGQDSLLQIVYRGEYDGKKRTEIKDGSCIHAFAKPLLLALVLLGFTTLSSHSQPSFRIDAVHFCCLDKGVGDCGSLAVRGLPYEPGPECAQVNQPPCGQTALSGVRMVVEQPDALAVQQPWQAPSRPLRAAVSAV